MISFGFLKPLPRPVLSSPEVQSIVSRETHLQEVMQEAACPTSESGISEITIGWNQDKARRRRATAPPMSH